MGNFVEFRYASQQDAIRHAVRYGGIAKPHPSGNGWVVTVR